jgi:DNA-binding response OmpR family regulator
MRKKILLIENSKHIAEMIVELLEDAKYEVSCVTNEAKIFEHIDQFFPDAILLDIVKPTLEGTELCRQLSLANQTAHIPVIVLSTHPEINKVKEICADEIIKKPFDVDYLLEVLNQQI